MLSDKERFRIEFARLVNVTFSSEMVDDDRRAYWVEVIEPAWSRLVMLWDSSGPVSEHDWQAVILNAITPCDSPSRWRFAKWRVNADRKALRIAQSKAANRLRIAEKTGDKVTKPVVNTKAFWQGQSFGPASEVKRIDPSTGEVIEVISQHDK